MWAFVQLACSASAVRQWPLQCNPQATAPPVSARTSPPATTTVTDNNTAATALKLPLQLPLPAAPTPRFPTWCRENFTVLLSRPGGKVSTGILPVMPTLGETCTLRDWLRNARPPQPSLPGAAAATLGCLPARSRPQSSQQQVQELILPAAGIPSRRSAPYRYNEPVGTLDPGPAVSETCRMQQGQVRRRRVEGATCACI
jgi:hypothetical protein